MSAAPGTAPLRMKAHPTSGVTSLWPRALTCRALFIASCFESAGHDHGAGRCFIALKMGRPKTRTGGASGAI